MKLKSLINIVYFTSTRADFDITKDLLKLIDQDEAFKLTVIVSGTHLQESYGLSYLDIKLCNFKNVIILEDNITTNTQKDIALNFSRGCEKLSSILYDLQPNLLMILGDRYETLACASIATILNVPVLHFHGGEKTLGSLDNKFRHAISSLASFHLVATDSAKQNLINLGIELNSIINIGSLSLANIENLNLFTKNQLLEKYNLPNKKLGILTLHPETNKPEEYNLNLLNSVIRFINKQDVFFIITSSNHDYLGEKFNIELKNYANLNPNKALFIPNLGKRAYFSVLSHFDYVLGNSSSAIIEAPIFQITIINIGNRQEGRSRNEDIINLKIEQLETFNLEFIYESSKNNKLEFVPANLSKVLQIIKTQDFYIR
jgi:GDP/UDP-N,N'-diacetylbacillosamine 2-epimerase (hydrolysing)